MKRILPLALILVMAAAAGAWYTNSHVPNADKASLLSFVPADTAFYFGYSKAYPADAFATHWRAAASAAGTNARLNPARVAQEVGPAAGMITALARLQQQATSQGTLYSELGLNTNGIGGFYETGGLPVLRLRLGDSEQFWQAMDKAETMAGLPASASANNALRRYAFKARNDGEPPELVIAERDGYAVFTMAMPGMENALSLALGERHPEKDLDDTKRLTELANSHGMLTWATGFIDHARLAKALIKSADSRLRRFVTGLARAYGEKPPALDAGCAADLATITGLWPRSVIGLTQLDSESGSTTTRWVITIDDNELVQTLRRLRGHIPQAGVNNSMADLGIGLDVAELIPVVQNLVGRFSGAAFRCPALVHLQKQANLQSLTGLGMIAAMAGDVSGARIDLAMPSEEEAVPEAIIAIATDRPTALWQMAKGFLGLSANPLIDGPPVALGHPMLEGQHLRIALRKDRIQLLAGTHLQPPDGDASSGLAANGLLMFDYVTPESGKSLLTKLDDLPIPSEGDPAQLDTLRQSLGGMKINYGLRLDITEQGVQLDISLTPGDTNLVN